MPIKMYFTSFCYFHCSFFFALWYIIFNLIALELLNCSKYVGGVYFKVGGTYAASRLGQLQEGG